MNKSTARVGALLALLLSVSATAGLPGVFEPVFTYQGQLKHNGQPFTGTRDMTFSLWNTAVGGSQTGDTLVIPVDVAGGLFQVELGFGGSTDMGQGGYLQIEVDGQILTPRQRLRPVPFALFAGHAVGGGGESPWEVEGDNIHYDNGDVGIGTSNPGARLDVSHSAGSAIRGVSQSTVGFFFGVNGRSAATSGVGVFGEATATGGEAVGVFGTSASTGGYGVRGTSSGASGTGVFAWSSSATGETYGVRGRVDSPDGYAGYFTGPPNSRNYFQGRVGIGTDNPTSRLEIEAPSTASPFRITVDGDTKMRLGNNGGLTIGSGVVTPDDGLRVAGAAVMVSPVTLVALGSAGATTLCRNAGNVISSCSSSARYKQDIENLETATALVGRMRAVSYRWIDSGDADIGLVAEEVAEVDPRLATYNDRGEIEGVKYDRVAAVLVRAWQEQQVDITRVALSLIERDQRIAALEAELAANRADTAARLLVLEDLLLETRRVAREDTP